MKICYTEGSKDEISDMADKWATLKEMVAARFPNSIKHAIAENNLACILTEFYRKDTSKQKNIQDCFTASSTIVGKIISHVLTEDVKKIPGYVMIYCDDVQYHAESRLRIVLCMLLPSSNRLSDFIVNLRLQ